MLTFPVVAKLGHIHQVLPDCVILASFFFPIAVILAAESMSLNF